MSSRRGLLWFRNDLRLHDNEALVEIMRTVDEIIPVYVFDDRQYDRILYDSIPQIFQTRALFTLQSVQNLKENLIKSGSNLVVKIGKPEEVIFELAKEWKTSWVFCNRERMIEEVAIQDRLEEKLWSIGQEIHYSRGKMLHYTQDLPFPITHTPDKFAIFRKETERIVPIRKPLSSPTLLKPIVSDIDLGDVPQMSDFGWSDAFFNPKFLGGETEALNQLDQRMAEVKQSAKEPLVLSPWLSNGSLSPKLLYQHLTEELVSKKKKYKDLVKNLYLRDYYRLIGKKNYKILFNEKGLGNQSVDNLNWDKILLQQWITGQTDHAYVNACMKFLYTYGYLNHQQRRIVAYYLVKELQVHWLLGAAYFESVLIDYDPCSNYNNWQRICGIGLDQKGEQPVNFDLLDQQIEADDAFVEEWREFDIDYVCN